MRTSLRITLTLVLAISGVSVAWADGRFHVPGTAYAAHFSGVPECETGKVETPAGAIERHVCAYYDERLGGGYAIEYVSLPSIPRTSEAQLILKSAAAGAAQESQSEITHESSVRIEGHPALDVVFLKRKEGSLARVRYVLVGRDLVTLSIDGGSRLHESPEAAAFLDSLRLGSPGSASP
ncbi:hypothetical protein V3391_06275 [Luteimonas sp. SMYT11W]|uniref:Uncharacterized protein n=1 Tax=Luteimonas flava TaxID=3115822 RepID=A0ABU7WE96_9GAMM